MPATRRARGTGGKEKEKGKKKKENERLRWGRSGLRVFAIDSLLGREHEGNEFGKGRERRLGRRMHCLSYFPPIYPFRLFDIYSKLPLGLSLILKYPKKMPPQYQ